MSQKPRRHTSSRSVPSQNRKITGEDGLESDDKSNLPLTGNWFYRQTPNNQVYYLKIALGVITGLLIGAFYNNSFIAGNWFFFPLIGLVSISFIARYYLEINKDDLNDLKLFLWSGTISMFIGFIASSSLVWWIFNPPFVNF